ncbi:peptidase S8/S53 domain-containing protein [Lactarius deliciosus]|nr:peptidase S8/S53 domain-containing protein [Lactarius deliciosus]
MTEYRSDGEDATFTVTQVNGGGYNPNRPISASSGRLNTATDPYLNWLAYLLNLETITRTISTTYGGPEYSAPKLYAESICEQFLKLGSRRISVVFSGGDWGVGRGDCLVQSKNRQVSVQFLVSCTYGIIYSLFESDTETVGGTTNDGPDIAAILSRGGLSNYFPRPYYQDIAVPLFLQDVLDIYGGLFRLIHPPTDLTKSYFTLNFEIATDGEFEEVDGTSGSAPTMVGIISLLNDYRLSKGKPSYIKILPGVAPDDLTPREHDQLVAQSVLCPLFRS